MKINLDASILKRMVFSFILLDLLYRFSSLALLHDLSGAVIPYTSLDLLYICLHLLNLPEYLMNGGVALAFDVALILSVLLSIIKVEWRWPAILSGLLLFLYMLVFNSYTNHHYHSMVGMILMTVPFYFRDEKSLELSWQSVRYYFLFIFASAALWKLFRGAIFDPAHMVAILKAQHILNMVEGGGNYIVQYLIAHPTVSYLLFLAGFLSQLVFLLGFMSSKFDRFLLYMLMLFMFMNLIIMQIFSFELIILGMTLIFTPTVKDEVS